MARQNAQKLPTQNKRRALMQRAAIIAAMRHATPVAIEDPIEQFEDYDDDELWDLVDEAADDDLYRAAHNEITRRQMSRNKRKPFRGPVRLILSFLLIVFMIAGPLLALWIWGWF